jgi:hypothetical protein
MKGSAILLLAAALLFEMLALPLYRLGPLALDPGGGAGIESVAPDFLLLAIIYLALADRSRRILVAAIGSGTAAGAFSLDPWFAPALSYLAVVSLLRVPAREGWGETALPRAGLVVVGLAAALAVRHSLLWLSEPDCVPPGAGAFVLEVAYGTLLALVVFPVLDAFRGRLVPPPARKLVPCE